MNILRLESPRHTASGNLQNRTSAYHSERGRCKQSLHNSLDADSRTLCSVADKNARLAASSLTVVWQVSLVLKLVWSNSVWFEAST